MENEYKPVSFEAAWTKKWAQQGLYRTPEGIADKQNMYILDMFPYPSGAGLHVGHIEGETATDILSRFMRMRGYCVLHPMGWDSFGLPAENFAIKSGVHPHETTEKAIKTFKQQMDRMGFSYDWDRELGAHREDYYRWTQWLFIFLYNKGLAYRAKAPVNWCPSCQTVLANEQVEEGKCERCGTEVIQKEMEQWFFKITDYAQRLLDDLQKLDWPESTKLGQKNWIGRSEGMIIPFVVANSKETIEVFTTRPDTIFGTTYVVLAPEHPLVSKISSDEQKEEIQHYQQVTAHKSSLQRSSLEKQKSGVYTGASAINPANNEKIPIWIADHVLMTYGTGAIMAVPAYDERDRQFAEKYELPINEIELTKSKEEMTAWLVQKKIGKKSVQFKLRDWLVSRQRYWGAPIPMIQCQKCGWQPVADKDLPVTLPTDVDFKPTGKSPIAYSKTFQSGVKCPQCGSSEARREVDTMDTFVDSSWYFFRFADPHNKTEFASKEALKKWLPVTTYVGGAEHTVLHLLYARFITKALHDAGYLAFDEPFTQLRHQGIVMGPDHRRMSKRWGNIINPDDEVDKYGADTVRLYEMFMGPLKDTKAWNTEGIQGIHRFLKRVWKLAEKVGGTVPQAVHQEQQKILHKTILYAQEAIPKMMFNTTLSKYMELINSISKEDTIEVDTWNTFLTILSPFAPFMTEELWARQGHTESIHKNTWPRLQKKLLEESTITLPVQVNGKIRGTITISVKDEEKEVISRAMQVPSVSKYLDGKQIVKTIYIKGKILTFVL